MRGRCWLRSTPDPAAVRAQPPRSSPASEQQPLALVADHALEIQTKRLEDRLGDRPDLSCDVVLAVERVLAVVERLGAGAVTWSISPATAERHEQAACSAPDLPTVSESVPGYEAALWFGILGPKALPLDLVARWNKEIERIVQLPEIRERMAAAGTEPVGGSPDHFRNVIARDITKWQTVVKAANIKVGN